MALWFPIFLFFIFCASSWKEALHNCSLSLVEMKHIFWHETKRQTRKLHRRDHHHHHHHHSHHHHHCSTWHHPPHCHDHHHCNYIFFIFRWYQLCLYNQFHKIIFVKMKILEFFLCCLFRPLMLLNQKTNKNTNKNAHTNDKPFSSLKHQISHLFCVMSVAQFSW